MLLGDNGVGKTSVLEAISMFSPGRGMLGSSIAEQTKDNIDGSLSVQCELNGSIDLQLSTCMIGGRFDKRVLINDKPLLKQADLLNWCHVIWFSAQIQYELFTSASFRRKFIDRFVFYIEPNHGIAINKYEKLLQNRSALLQEKRRGQRIDDRFVSVLEQEIAQVSSIIVLNRLKFVNAVNDAAGSFGANNYVRCTFVGFDLMKQGNLTRDIIVDTIITNLAEYRNKDTLSGRSHYGVHRTDYDMFNSNDESVYRCSSGQQKVLYLNFLYHTINVVAKHSMRHPILLLDEIVSFLDPTNIHVTLSKFGENASQIWITTNTHLPHVDNHDFEVITLPLD